MLRVNVRSGRVSIPTLDPRLIEFMALMREPSLEIEKVLDNIGREPALAVEILRRANVIHFAGIQRVKTLREACVRLGNKEVFAIGFELVLRQSFEGRHEPYRRWLSAAWANSLIAARIAEELARQIGGVPADVARLAALLHNCGELLAVHGVEDLVSRRQEPLLVGEEQMAELARDVHEELGAEMLKKWALPSEVCEVVIRHHARPATARRSEIQQLRDIAVSSWVLAMEAGASYWAQPDRDVEAIAELLNLPLDNLTQLVEAAAAWVQSELKGAQTEGS